MTPTHQLDVASGSLLCGCRYTVYRCITVTEEKGRLKEEVKYNYLDRECEKCKEAQNA
jgi:hypothetical protein